MARCAFRIRTSGWSRFILFLLGNRIGSPSRNLLLRYGVIADARNADLVAARAAGELLIAAVLTQTAAVARADIAKVAALPRLASRRSYLGVGSAGGVGGVCGSTCIRNVDGTGTETGTKTRTGAIVRTGASARSDRDARVGSRGSGRSAGAADAVACDDPSSGLRIASLPLRA